MRLARTGTPEHLRSAGTGASERARSSGHRTSEYLLDPYYRAHPPQLGCTLYSVQAVAGLGVAGCMVAGVDRGTRP